MFISEIVHNEIKCQISMKKWINIFTFAYGQGRGEGANPTSNPPYRKYDRKISVFYAFPKQEKYYFSLSFYEHILGSVKVKS